ncbi:MAG: EAL domain-containing protein, partial [Gammaproteobacteria bacterium]|nr:EAL domain-containing protein [Gammaproteobacteria bacterium]
KQTINMITTASLLIIFFLGLGMLLVNRVVRAIKLISNDFERIGNQDFKPSTITSPFSELSNMVKGFNRMIQEIARKQQCLNQAQIVFDNTSEGVIITDANARIVSVNNAFTNITGYSENEVIGQNPSMLQSRSHDKEFYKNMWQSINTTGCWRGEVLNRRKNGERYTELLSINSFKDEQGNVIQYVGVITDISSIKDTEHKLKHLAHHDPLTGLPNRLLCNARLEHELQLARRQNHMVVVMFIDLDMFKTINDSLGHILGDELLRKVTERISQYIRDEDTIARLGGDEFVLILGSINNRVDATNFAKNLLSLFSSSFNISGHEVFISASVGIALYPDHGNNVDSLLRNADAAMYRAKAEGRNNFQYYTVDLTNKAFERMSQETYLRHALNNNELILHYQPQYSLKTGKMIAVEALIRWLHPELGLVYPDKFISVAEETGLIVPIGEWIIETACRQLNLWGKSAHPSLRMAINLSARQFWKPGLTHVIKNALDNNHLDADRLDLEMTESVIMRDTDITIDTLNCLHSMGVELSIDDFGTGYSSLSYLKRFPINRLKIDRSFVSDITTDKNDADMIHSIIALGHCMKLKVLAEGVETKEQLTFLKQYGCDEVQGYYYSRPLPADELEQLFTNTTVALCN